MARISCAPYLHIIRFDNNNNNKKKIERLVVFYYLITHQCLILICTEIKKLNPPKEIATILLQS